jgi:hypothetical protein
LTIWPQRFGLRDLPHSRWRFGFLRSGFDGRVSVSATWFRLFRCGFGDLAWATWLRRYGFDVLAFAFWPSQFGFGDLAWAIWPRRLGLATWLQRISLPL